MADPIMLELDYISQAFSDGNEQVMSVGFFGEDVYPDGESVVEVAMWNEYGNAAEGKPPRPFMRHAASEHEREWELQITDALRLGATRGTPMVSALEALGRTMVSDIKQSIIDFKDPPNSASTVRAKGKDDPLRDTDHMLNSVKYKLGVGDESETDS